MTSAGTIFKAIDKHSSEGLESMLKTTEQVALKDHDYSTVFDARYMLKKLELGLLEEVVEESKEVEQKKEQLHEASKQFNLEAGRAYQKDGKLMQAAKHLDRGGAHSEAVELYLKEGSEESIDKAIQIMIYEGVDVEKGVMMQFERGKIFYAFLDLEHGVGRISEDERQRIGKKLVKKLYSKTIKDIKSQIAEKEGKSAIPKTNSLKELMKGRGYISTDSSSWGNCLDRCSNYYSKSDDPALLRIGLEMNEYQRKYIHAAEFGQEHYKDGEIFLKGKLGNVDEAVSYFIKEAEREKEDFSRTITVEKIVALYRSAKKLNAALEVVEKFLKPNHNLRFELLEEIGDKQKLLDACKGVNDPVKYAFVSAGLKPSESKILY